MVYILPISLWDCLTSYTGGSPFTYLLSALAFPVFFLIFFPYTLRDPTQPTQHELYPNANDPGTLLRVSGQEAPGLSRLILLITIYLLCMAISPLQMLLYCTSA